MMKKKILVFFLLALGMNRSSAGEFDEGSPEFDTGVRGRYSEEEIQYKIEKEMEVSCSHNLCKIAGTDAKGSGWEVSFQIGHGHNSNNGAGDIFYIGNGYGEGTKEYANLTITYKNNSCRSALTVTPAIYRFVNTYMYNMVNADASVKKNFSPADQTVILFYTTLLTKVESCRSL